MRVISQMSPLRGHKLFLDIYITSTSNMSFSYLIPYFVMKLVLNIVNSVSSCEHVYNDMELKVFMILKRKNSS